MQGRPRRNRSQISSIRSILWPLQAPTLPSPRRLPRELRPSRTQVRRLDRTDLRRKVRLSLRQHKTDVHQINTPDTSYAVDANSPCVN